MSKYWDKNLSCIKNLPKLLHNSKKSCTFAPENKKVTKKDTITPVAEQVKKQKNFCTG